MKWVKKKPETGDMVRIKRSGVYHYGIFVGNGRVVQFGTANNASETYPSDVRVNLDLYDVFSCDSSCLVSEYEKNDGAFPGNVIAQRALARIGEGGYDFIRNNCEHFVRECAFGVHKAPETEKFSRIFAAIPRSAVYVSPYPFCFAGQNEGIFPLERRREIEKSRVGAVRCQKYYAWKLLEYALHDFADADMKDLNFRRNSHGKWETDGVFLSLSHTKNLCAVGLSDRPIGVDIEIFTASRFNERLARHILTEEEEKRYKTLEKTRQERFCAAAWTGKESTFKRLNQKNFAPRQVDGFSSVVTKNLLYEGGEYFLSCSGDLFRRVRFFAPESIEIRNFPQ